MRFLATVMATLALPAGALAAEIVVPRADGVPSAPGDPAWEQAPATAIALMPQLITPPTGGGAVQQAEVRALHDGGWMSVRVAWADDTPDRAVGVDVFRDAAAIGFPVSDEPTSPFMGDAEHPVAIWQWSANHQANNDGQGEFAARYPRVDGVWYADHDAMASVRVHRWRGVEPVEHFEAHGFGTLTPVPDDSLTGSGTWSEAGWAVVFQRRLASSAEPTFAPGGSTQLIVALWDGGSGEVNGRKAVTMAWTPMILEK